MKTFFAFMFVLFAAFFADASSIIANSLQEARAIQAYKDKKYDEALKIYNQLAAGRPYDAGYNYNIGDILYKSEKFQESIPYYQRAIEHGDMQTKVQSTFNIGNVHMQIKAYDDAISSYENVLKLDPENQPAKHNLEVAKKMKQQKEQEDQKQDQDQKQDSEDQKDDQDEKQGKDNQQKDQKSSSDKNSKNKEKKSGDQKDSDQGKDQKGDSSEKKEDRSDQKQGQKDQQKESQEQKEHASKNNAEKSDEEIEQDLAQAQKEQREKQEKKQSTPQSGNASEEKQVPQQLDDSLYQEMQKSAADDDRLSAKEAHLMQQMENLEKNVTKDVMKHMIRTQTAGVDDGKKW